MEPAASTLALLGCFEVPPNRINFNSDFDDEIEEFLNGFKDTKKTIVEY